LRLAAELGRQNRHADPVRGLDLHGSSAGPEDEIDVPEAGGQGGLGDGHRDVGQLLSDSVFDNVGNHITSEFDDPTAVNPCLVQNNGYSLRGTARFDS